MTSQITSQHTPSILWKAPVLTTPSPSSTHQGKEIHREWREMKRSKTGQIFFSLGGGKGIEHLDAVGFVTQSRL